MFGIGEEIICINNADLRDITPSLILYKKYTVMSENNRYVLLNEIYGIAFETNRFVLLSEYRKRKIENINSKLKNNN